MLTTTSDSNRIKHFKEIKTQAVKQPLCATHFLWQLRPRIICLLCSIEYGIYGTLGIK